MIVYLLQHDHCLPEGSHDSKLLGVFSSLYTCNSAIEEYKSKPGFLEQPNNFEVVECTVTEKKGQLNLIRVFVVQHEYEDSENYEYIKLIGIFASSQEARRKVAAMRKTPPYDRTPLGFSIDDYPLDKMYWLEGYDTWDTEK